MLDALLSFGDVMPAGRFPVVAPPLHMPIRTRLCERLRVRVAQDA